MSVITRNISTDFSGTNPKNDQLQSEINANITILSSCTAVNTENDDVDINFDGVLSAPEITELDAVISNHTPLPVFRNVSTVVIGKDTRFSNYRQMALFPLQKVSSCMFKAVSYMDIGSTSYSIKISTFPEGTIIAEKTFTNTVLSTVDMGVGQNVPSDEKLIRIDAKRVGGIAKNKVYIESIQMHYSN